MDSCRTHFRTREPTCLNLRRQNVGVFSRRAELVYIDLLIKLAFWPGVAAMEHASNKTEPSAFQAMLPRAREVDARQHDVREFPADGDVEVAEDLVSAGNMSLRHVGWCRKQTAPLTGRGGVDRARGRRSCITSPPDNS